jgi:DNA-binding MarR family transcriptional regulator
MAQKQAVEVFTSSDGATLLMVAHKRLHGRIKGILEDYGLNLTQWLIISRLGEKQNGLRTTDLAHFMNVEVPLVTMMSRPLRTRGLITSEAHTPDKREKLLNLTDRAKEIMAAVERRMQKQVAVMLKDVSMRDLKSYLKVLQSMVHSPA